MDLDAQDASEVLAHDELAIGHPGHESQVLTWFKELVAYKIERYARARKVWEAVHFELLSVQELLSFQEDINSNKLWAEVRQELGGVLRAALDCKLADNPAQGKKIKATILDTSATEKNMTGG